MPSNVRVAVRVRPLLPKEIEKGHRDNLLQINTDDNQISIMNPDSNQKKNY